MTWVHVISLEAGEQQLDRHSIVAVRPGEENGYPESLHQLHRALAGVVGSSVEEDYAVLSPTLVFLVQFKHQLPEEDLHGPVVRVGLQEREVGVSLGVKAREHGDPWLHAELWYRVGGLVGLPLPVPEVGHAEPSLVYVHHSLALHKEPDQLKGELLPQHEVSFAVGVHGHRLDLPVSHAELLLHNLS